MKRKGFTFDYAFPRAVRLIDWPWDTNSRQQWKAALQETRSTWQACYEARGEPLTVNLLASAIADFDLASAA